MTVNPNSEFWSFGKYICIYSRSTRATDSYVFFYTDFITFLYGRTNQFGFLSNKFSFDGGRISSVARVLDYTAGGRSFDLLGCI